MNYSADPVIDLLQTIFQEQMSECRSFGSTYHLSSQSRKISIGVMVDSLAGKKPVSTKGDENALPRVEKLNSANGNDLEANKKQESISAANRRNAAQAPEHVSSPWRSPKSSHRKLGTLENVLCRQTSSLSGSKGLQKDLNGVNQAPAEESLQQFRTSKFQSSDDKLNFGERKKGKDGSRERLKEFASAAAQGKIVSGGPKEDKGDKAESRSTETLRTKLWEILGTVSSPRSHHSNSEGPEVRDNELKLDQNTDPKSDKFVKPRINSDTIETDSESPENAARRPMTRSLLRKRAPTRAAQKITTSGAYSSHKHKEQEKTIFSFEEGLLGQIGAAANVSSVPKNKKTRRKAAVAQWRNVHSPEKDKADEIQRETRKNKTLPPAKNVQTEKTSSISRKQGSVDGCPPHNRICSQTPENGIMEEDFHQSQATKTANKPGILHGLSENGDKRKEVSNPSMKKAVEPQDDFHSPTFGFRTPMSSPSPNFSPETIPVHSSDTGRALEETETPAFSFGTKKTSQAASYGPNVEKELSDVSEKSRDYSSKTGTSAKLNEDSEGLSESSSDERDSNGSGEDSPLMQHYNCCRGRETSPEGTHKKSKFVFPLANPKGTRLGELSPTSSPLKGVHETDCVLGSSGMHEDDALGRAVTLFALALQNFERKMKSAARKKSTEILASVSEEIHLQMENAESYILTDVGKLSNITKTKRKHVETRFQEQQEQLKLIHDKFRDDISHHLEDFKGTLEELEANRTELKATIKKQKVSHQKLITQLEGEVETQLVNAERRINAVNESARGKMLQLKRIVAECLKDDILD